MKTELDNPVRYHLVLNQGNSEKEELEIPLNDYLSKNIRLKHTGRIYDLYDGKLIKKSYGQGYSYKNFISLARCDSCVVKPELCHYDKGTCREPDWGLKHCFIPHYIYLAKTSDVKIGITRHTQIPTRWIDQGAIEAMPILKVKDRKTSGLIEVEIARLIPDKTNWRKMLSGEEHQGPSLDEYKELVFDSIPHLLDDLDAEEVEDLPTFINYPVLEYPKKISSFNFDKNPEISGTLLGIKGQYLIFDNGVINIRKYQGYEIEFYG
jgi:hypothetical protein